MVHCKASVAFAVLACLSAVALGQLGADENEIFIPGVIIPPVDDQPSVNENADPKPCCLPNQWQGVVTGQSGHSKISKGDDDDSDSDDEDDDKKGGKKGGGFQQFSSTMYVDQVKQSVAGKTAVRNDTAGFIVLFGKNNTADIYLFLQGAKKCLHRKSNRAQFHKQCIPTNATFGGNVNVGPAAGGLAAQIWNFGSRPHEGPQAGGVFVSGRALVTPACVPIFFQNHGFVSKRGPGPKPEPPSSQLRFQSYYNKLSDDKKKPKGDGFMGSTYFNNVESTIKDPNVFKPPSFCNTTLFGYRNTLILGVDMDFPEILDSFVTL